MRDRWERMAPRERRLVLLLGATLVLCIFSWIGYTIRDGLRAIEDKNEETRSALDSLARYRAAAAQPVDQGPKVEIPDEAIVLPTYLEEAAKDVGLTIPDYSPRQPTLKGKYNEVTVNITLKGVTVDELRQFLERVETKSRIVVVQSMRISREFRDNQKLDVEMTVATYEKIKPKKTDKGEPSSGGSAAPKAEEG